MKPGLSRNRQGMCCVLLAVLSVATAASTGPGYLPRVGPAPLRFLAPPRVCTKRFVLPVPVPDPASVVPQIEKMPPLPRPASSALELPGPMPQAESGPAQPQMETAPADAVVSPQMLLRYFTQTNNSAASVIAPMEFTPPRAAVPAPSKATFSIGP